MVVPHHANLAGAQTMVRLVGRQLSAFAIENQECGWWATIRFGLFCRKGAELLAFDSDDVNRVAFGGEEFDFVSAAAGIDMHDRAAIAGAQTVFG